MLVWFTLKPYFSVSNGINILSNYHIANFSASTSVTLPGDCYYCEMVDTGATKNYMVYFCGEDGDVITGIQETTVSGSQNLLLALYPGALVAPVVDPYADQLQG